MVIERVLIIEGAKDERNGILRQGFHKLLVQILKGRMPRIIMGDGKKVSSKIPQRPPMDIPNPSDLLNDIVFSLTTKRYHKVIHAVELLKLLDASKLTDDFEDFRKLTERLKN